jgi:hypothetical protein
MVSTPNLMTHTLIDYTLMTHTLIPPQDLADVLGDLGDLDLPGLHDAMDLPFGGRAGSYAVLPRPAPSSNDGSGSGATSRLLPRNPAPPCWPGTAVQRAQQAQHVLAGLPLAAPPVGAYGALPTLGSVAQQRFDAALTAGADPAMMAAVAGMVAGQYAHPAVGYSSPDRLVRMSIKVREGLVCALLLPCLGAPACCRGPRGTACNAALPCPAPPRLAPPRPALHPHAPPPAP